MLHWQMLQINWNTVMWAATANVWVSRPALNPLHHKSTPSARQTESDLVRTTLLPPFYYWVAPSMPWTRTRPDTQLANSWLPPTADSQPLAADSQPCTHAVPHWLSPGYPSTQKFQPGSQTLQSLKKYHQQYSLSLVVNFGTTDLASSLNTNGLVKQ